MTMTHNQKSYSEKLRDPRWQRKRLEIMQRDDFKCRSCGASDKTLNIHHIRYLQKTEPWDYKDFYLVTLCEACHLEEEYRVGTKQRPEPLMITPLSRYPYANKKHLREWEIKQEMKSPGLDENRLSELLEEAKELRRIRLRIPLESDGGFNSLSTYEREMEELLNAATEA